MEVLPKNHFPISYNESLFPLNKACPPKGRADIIVDNSLYTKLRDVDFKGGFALTQDDIQNLADPIARHLVVAEEEDKFNKGHPVINALNKDEQLKKLLTSHFSEQFKIKKMEQRKAYEEKVKKDLELRGLNLNAESITQFVEEHHVREAIKGSLEAPPEVAQLQPTAEELFGRERLQQDEEAGLRLGGLDIRRNLGFAEVMAHDGVDYNPDEREAVAVDPTRSLASNLLTGIPQRGSTSGMGVVNNAGRLASRVDGYLLEADPYDLLLGERQQRRNRSLVDLEEDLNVPIQGHSGIASFKATIPSGTGGVRWNLVNDMGQVRDEDTLGYRRYREKEFVRNYQAREEAKKTMGKALSGVKEYYDNRQVAQGLVDSIIQDALIAGRQRRQVVVEEDEEDEEKNARARQHLKKRAFQKLQASVLEKKILGGRLGMKEHYPRNRADIEHALRYEGSAKSQGKLGKHSSKEELGAGLARAISKGDIKKGVLGTLGVGNTTIRSKPPQDLRLQRVDPAERAGGGGGALMALIKGEE